MRRMAGMAAMAVVAIGCALGCKAAPTPMPAPAPTPGPPPTPAAPDAAGIARLGQQIYALDDAADRASDVAVAAGLTEQPIDGWIVVPSPPGWLVRFIGACPEASAGACAHMDVQVSDDATPPVALRANPPKPLPGEQALMWRARETAATAEFNACTPTYNTVVLPRTGDAPWRVYLLAASEDPDDVVLNGHYRVTVSADGATLLATEALSRDCVILKASSAPADSAGLFVTDGLNAAPIETHVFTSLSYGRPLFVKTAQGAFKVAGAEIEPVELK